MAAELQSAYAMSGPNGGMDGHFLLILGIMVAMGLLGGAANVFLAERQGEPARRDWIKYPIFGVLAALTVPLFLNMLASTLLEGTRTKAMDLYVFAGFCLIYVIASRRLFDNLAQRLFGQLDQVSRDIGQIKSLQAEVAPAVPVSEAVRPAEPDPREVLSYNDVEILRTLAGESVVYGNLAIVCERTGLQRELVGQRLAILKNLGVIETRINERNVLHWAVSARGKGILEEIVGAAEERKSA